MSFKTVLSKTEAYLPKWKNITFFCADIKISGVSSYGWKYTLKSPVFGGNTKVLSYSYLDNPVV